MRIVSALLLPILLACVASATALPPATANSATQDALIARVEAFLYEQAEGYPGSVEVTVDASERLDDAPCSEPQITLASGQRLRARLSVSLRCPAPAPWSATVQATLAIRGFFYVASRDLAPGHTVSLNDLIPREADILTLARGIVVDPSQLVDHITTQRIPAGTPLKARALRSPFSVQRGQIVRIEVLGQGFMVTSDGRSLQDGGPGEQIRIRTESGRVISATVINATTVRILL